MNFNFVVLSHNEPEIFRVLEQLIGQNVFVIDDWSEASHFERIRFHPCLPTVLRRSLNRDFSAQRNFVDQFIPAGEWVITIDADEIFDSVVNFMAELILVETEAARIRRINVTLLEDGSEQVTVERHIRAYRKPEDGRAVWVNSIHELPSGFKNETFLSNSVVIHVKDWSRCVSQSQFYAKWNC